MSAAVNYRNHRNPVISGERRVGNNFCDIFVFRHKIINVIDSTLRYFQFYLGETNTFKAHTVVERPSLF